MQTSDLILVVLLLKNFGCLLSLSARTARLKQFVSYNVRPFVPDFQFKGWLGREFVTLTHLMLSFEC